MGRRTTFAALLYVLLTMSVSKATAQSEANLLKAAKSGKTDVVESLLKMGVSVDAANKHGKTALMFAAEKGRVDVVRVLLDHGAKVSATTEDRFDGGEETALILAAAKGRGDIVKVLLDANADPFAVDGEGLTALDRARKSDVIELLKNRRQEIIAATVQAATARVAAGAAPPELPAAGNLPYPMANCFINGKSVPNDAVAALKNPFGSFVCGNTAAGKKILTYRRWYCAGQAKECVLGKWPDGKPSFVGTVTTDLKVILDPGVQIEVTRFKDLPRKVLDILYGN